MPFQSERQRKWMWANRPDLAKKWAKSYGPRPVRKMRRRHATKR